MLKEIICDKLADKKLVFKNGLNVVVGDDDAANSIGKSNCLLLIDYAFGGNSYASSDDVMTHVGQHELKIHFVIDDTDYFFLRNTSVPNTVYRCDAIYQNQKIMTADEYRQLLLSLYHIPSLHLSFREIVSQFSRIYQVKNCDETKPLNPGYNHKEEDRVVFLMKLMNKYQKVVEQDAVKKNAVEKLNAYNRAVKLKLIPVFNNQKEYKKNEQEIERLNSEMTSIKTQIAYRTMNLTSEQLAQIGVLKTKLARIQKEKSLTISLIEKLKQNLEYTNGNLVIDENKIKELFPTAELKKMEDVNRFHSRLTAILSEEINGRIRKEQKRLAWICEQESSVIEQVAKVAAETTPDNLVLDRLVSTKQSVDLLISGRESYETRRHLQQDKKGAISLYDEIVTNILTDIEYLLNKEMERLNKLIMGDVKKSPRISLSPNKYKVLCEGDTGAGTGYRRLITFDLAILNLTVLPFLIHDSILFKNVEDDAVKGIFDLYASSQKQLFVSIDKLPSYQKEVRDVVEAHKVLKLSRDHTLYGKVWNR